MKIYLSPSAQPHNAYAAGNTTEQIQCNRIAEAAKTALERNGYTVKKAPEGQSYVKNVAESNAWGADLHLPIHTNAGGSSKGTMGICYPGYSGNKYMQNIYNAVAAVTPWSDLGIRERSDLYELNSTKMMCVYIECAFHDKADSAQWIIDNVKVLGEAIAKGICAADGKGYKGEGGTGQVPGNPVNDFGLSYESHVQSYGWLPTVHDGQTSGTTGEGKRMEGLHVDLRTIRGRYPNVKLKAKAHVQGAGWVEYEDVEYDTLLGTAGEGKRLEALELEITGLGDGMNIYYRTHLANSGWTGWIAGGFTSGSVGISKSIEAIQMKIE